MTVGSLRIAYALAFIAIGGFAGSCRLHEEMPNQRRSLATPESSPVTSPSEIKQAIKLLDDGDPKARLAAADVLVRGGRLTVSLLLTDYHGTNRMLAAAVLAEIAALDTRAFIATLKNEDSTIAERAAYICGKRRIGPLIDAAGSPDTFVRERSLSILCDLGDARAAGVLLDAFRKSRSVMDASQFDPRLDYVKGLGRMGSPAANDLLTSIALADPRDDMRQAAVWALGKIGCPCSVLPLSRVSGSDNDPDVRREAASALGDLGGDKATAALRKLARDQDPSIRLAALGGLAKLGARTGILDDVLRIAKQHPDLQEECAEVLGSLHDIKARDFLVTLLDASDPHAASAAAAALAEIGDQTAAGKIRMLLTDKCGTWTGGTIDQWEPHEGPTPATACRYLGALGKLRDKGSVDAIAEFINEDTHPQIVVIAAVIALSDIGDPRSEPVLLKMLTSPDPEVLVTAIYALGQMGTVKSLGELEALRQHRLSEVTEAAAKAIVKITVRCGNRSGW